MPLKIENSRRVAESRPVCMDLKAETRPKLIKQPMNGNFKRYVDQITQNVNALLNI
jgi:hypothetical protein